MLCLGCDQLLSGNEDVNAYPQCCKHCNRGPYCKFCHDNHVTGHPAEDGNQEVGIRIKEKINASDTFCDSVVDDIYLAMVANTGASRDVSCKRD